ncbi:MAG TPA: sulfotransferase domain-containing protein [Ktedonobacteraceae bacterium]|jgi:hypothetical protein|nr:sulfotransferase domain-containing protein [Ktedonobacteraceae bacterium]
MKVKKPIEPIKQVAKSAERFYRVATSSVRLMPDFIIIGVARGGTTSLYEYLIDHPNIVGASRKEIHFFDNQYQKGLKWYRGQFPYSMQKYYAEHVQKKDFVTGEASPYYIFHPHAARRLKKALPNVKMIVLFRNPIERAFSHYCWEVGWGDEKLSFEEAIEREQERISVPEQELAQRYSFNHQHYSYLARGLYADQLEKWFSLFPREQFLLLKSEDMYKDAASIYKQTLEFLNVPYSDSKALKTEFKQYNKPKYTPPKKMDPELRKRLVDYFEPHNQRLYKLVGRDFGWE